MIIITVSHYPIFIESNNSIVEERVQHWRLHRADWEAFQQSCGESLTIFQFENEEGVDDPIALFTAKLHDIAVKSIPKTSTVPKKNSTNPGLMKVAERQ